MSSGRAAVALGILALAAGCGGGHGELAGTVTYKGKPILVGSVLVAGEDGQVRSALIHEGSYSISEVPVGQVKVAVSSPDPKSLPAKTKYGVTKPPEDAAKWFPIPAMYADFTRSELQFTLQRGPNRYDIDLK